MKVCMITGTLPPVKCGVGDYSNILCKYLIKFKEIKLSIITTKGIQKSNEYEVYDIVKEWSNSDIKAIIKKIDEINPDIVHIQYPTSAYKKNIMINILPFFIRKKYKIITTVHEYSDNSNMGKIRTWPNIFYSNALLVVENKYKEEINKISFFKNKKIYFVNIGSNIPKSKNTIEERNLIRKSILKNDCNKIMGYFGFITKTKGIESIIYAMNLLKIKGKLRTIFLIVGELKKENEYHKYIVDLINKFNLNDYIYITGYLDAEDVGDYINATDYMVLPFVDGLSSKNGSFLAALQEGRRIITTLKDGVREFNEQNIVYLDKYDDIDKLKTIIESNQKETQDNHYKINLNNEYKWENIACRHLEIYKSII